ncbi:hypothetical protein LY39_01574 [Roseinatronobacter bogoriensis subsp. barguzinensis]|nr:hypothetical protein [Rhodobaca bogoriensis DSM 18756]TDW38551.1 hypothetical protein LY39_01574 [Rhodobaca barguzinensis]TDY69409.1 hypothetical protein EV660_104294 [Rhodobaca bogoriensis DSM 18756]
MKLRHSPQLSANRKVDPGDLNGLACIFIKVVTLTYRNWG